MHSDRFFEMFHNQQLDQDKVTNSTQGHIDQEQVVLYLLYGFLLLLYFNLKILKSTKLGKNYHTPWFVQYMYIDYS